MTGFDIAVLLVLGFSAVTGFMRGFVAECLALVAWISAAFAIRYMHTPLTEGLRSYAGIESGAAVLAFALLLLVPYGVVKLIAAWVGGKSRDSFLGPIDRLLGFGFGAVKGTIIVVLAFSILVLGFDVTWGPSGRPGWITQARSYSFINAASEELVSIIAERHQRMRKTDSGLKG